VPDLVLKVPEKLAPVMTSMAPYVVVYGGRDKGASWTIAQRVILKLYQSPRFFLCGREVQNSISDSVHKLLTETIERMGLEWFFEILATEIRGMNGSRVIYAGLRTDPKKVKSAEGLTDAWIEEAEAVSDDSWDILLPTLGRTCIDSQVFVSFNPFSDGDPTYIRYVLSPPTGALVINANWWDNPWFPPAHHQLRKDDYQRNPQAAAHIWEGKTVEQAGTTEFPMENIHRCLWDVDRFDQKNWYLLVDPSGSRKAGPGREKSEAQRDWTVMSPVGLGVDRCAYHGHWVRDKLDIDEKWDTMVNLNEKYHFKAIGYEDSSGGIEIDYFAKKGRETGYRLPIIPLKATKKKEDRIRWLVPLVRDNQLILPEHSIYTQLDGVVVDLTQQFLKEMKAFPHISAALHDDMLDATSRIMDPDLNAIFPSATPRPIRQAEAHMKWDAATKRMVPKR